MHRLVSFTGLLAIIAIAFIFSKNKRKIRLQTVVGGIALQFLFAIFMLKTGFGIAIFEGTRAVVETVLSLSDKGADFVFGEKFREHFFAFSVLPTIIFVASLTAVCFHLGILQKVVEFLARIMRKVMGVSGSESLAAAAEIFVGQTESPLFVRPYLDTMTVSELLAMMTAGMGTIAAGVLAAYASFGIPAGHLLTASVLGAPASLVIAKMLLPETVESPTMGTVKCVIEKRAVNVLDAACQGAADGVKLAINVAAMLIAFISLVALINLLLGYAGSWVGLTLSLQEIFGWICRPLAFLMGVPWNESGLVGQIIGEKCVINEFYAYIHLGKLHTAGQLSPRAVAIATYALCGFANFASIAIQVGGIGGLAPSRRADFARLGFLAFLGGNLANFMTACIAGIIL